MTAYLVTAAMRLSRRGGAPFDASTFGLLRPRSAVDDADAVPGFYDGDFVGYRVHHPTT
jgi:hypothetical protein